MIWAIGIPGQVCRMLLESPDEGAAELQCLPGEVAFQVENLQPGIIKPVGGGYNFEPVIHIIPWRVERNQRLLECDWTVMPDSPKTEEQRELWIIYRQELRDFDGIGPWPIAPE